MLKTKSWLISNLVRLTEEVLFAEFIEAELLFTALLELNDELAEHGLHLNLGFLLLGARRLVSHSGAGLGGLLLIVLLLVFVCLHFSLLNTTVF